MKRLTFLCLVMLCWTPTAGAITMEDLFSALHDHPVTELDMLQTRASELKQQSVYDRFYPSISGELGYQEFNSPTNWRPVLPTESAALLANNEALPFSETLRRIGAEISFPVFVKELFSQGKQTESLLNSARARTRLNFLEHQAVLVTADAHLIHMNSLTKSLTARKTSLEKTRADVILKVKNGRIPETEQIRMDEAITLIELTLNETHRQEIELQKTIEALTSIYLKQPLPLQLIGEINAGELYALKPLQESLKAGKYGVQAAKDKLYPRILASAKWYHYYGEGYNTGGNVDDEYGFYGLTLQMPLFNKPAYTAIEQAEIELHKEKARLSKTEIQLQARARSLQKTIKLLDSSKDLAAKSVEHERKLLDVAKISYASRRMNQEEYLRYEEKVLSAEARLYLTKAQWWETFSALAVLYGNNLQQLIK